MLAGMPMPSSSTACTDRGVTCMAVKASLASGGKSSVGPANKRTSPTRASRSGSEIRLDLELGAGWAPAGDPVACRGLIDSISTRPATSAGYS